MSDSEGGEIEHAVGGILGSVEVINLASDIDQFEDWLQDEHGVSLSDDLLEGYEFFMETAIRTFIHEIIYSTFPLIDEDFVFFRARFEGVKLAKIPNTSDKTAFIKNVNDYRRNLRKAGTWDETQAVLDEFSEEVLQQFEKLLQNHTVPDPDVDMNQDELLRQLAIFSTFVHLNDLDDGYPNGYYLTVLESDLREERLDAALEGYIYTLQFVWAQLVEDEVYDDTSLSALHDSEEWFHSFDIFEGVPDDRSDLDRFFGDIKREIIQPFEEDKGIKVLDDVLFLKEDTPEDLLEELAEREETVDLNTQEEFNHQLLWYQVEFLQASSIFNGVSAFLSLLSGTVNLKKRFAEGEKAYVCKFTHPVEPGNDYSYGVLVEAAGNTGLADYSGWVMFYDCCGDYSGFAGSGHLQAERLIEEHLEKDQIMLREMELEKDEFQELVSDKAIGERGADLSEELDLESERNRLQTKVRRARGLLVELVSHYYLSRQGYDSDELDWNISLDSGELDILVESTEEVRFIECKYDPSNQDWQQEFDKLRDKMGEPDTEKNKQGEFWFWNSPPPETVSRLEQNGFEYEVVSEIVRDASEFREKDLEHLQFVMEKIDRGRPEIPDDEIKPWEL
jgi:hypothetical protein